MAQLGKPSDEPAFKRIHEAFPDCIVYPIKYVQSLTRLGGGLHCATWNTVEKCYQNAKVFKPSKRHPFNPFTADAMSDERLRAVVEYSHEQPLEDSEWDALLNAFYTWSGEWLNSELSYREMVESIYATLSEQQLPFFEDHDFVEALCNHLYSYLIDIPKLFIPENSKWDSGCIYYPTVHFKDTDALLTSFEMKFGYREMSYLEEMIITEAVEEEAKKTVNREKGIVYVLYYKNDKRRVCPHRYTFTACKGDAHIKVIMYWDSPITNLPISKYAQKACFDISFFENCVKDDSNMPF